MNDLPTFTFLATYGAPFWIPAALALASTGLQTTNKFGKYQFRNKYARAGFVIFALGVALWCVATALWSLGGCQGGFIDPVECTKYSDGVARFIHAYTFDFAIIASAVGVPSLTCYGVAEYLTRRRAQRTD